MNLDEYNGLMRTGVTMVYALECYGCLDYDFGPPFPDFYQVPAGTPQDVVERTVIGKPGSCGHAIMEVYPWPTRQETPLDTIDGTWDIYRTLHDQQEADLALQMDKLF